MQTEVFELSQSLARLTAKLNIFNLEVRHRKSRESLLVLVGLGFVRVNRRFVLGLAEALGHVAIERRRRTLRSDRHVIGEKAKARKQDADKL